MMLRQITLDSFAGLSNLVVSFGPGLNVVLGPNEAGKSTLVNALRAVLFVPTKCGKRRWEKDLANFAPLGGGDTIRTHLEFRVRGGDHELVKSWGKREYCELRLPQGQVLSDAEAVESVLGELLALKKGTYENVLIAQQTKLPATLEDLSGDGQETEDLADLLRRSSFATDGVSIERLCQAIDAKRSSYYSRWDDRLQRPEGNRGIEQPWKNQVGQILEAWYTRERLRWDRQRVEEYERAVDAKIAQINKLSRERDSLTAFVDANKTIVEDLERRVKLEAEHKNLANDERILKKVYQDWPQLEAQLKRLGEMHENECRALEDLERELQTAKSYEATQTQRNKLERAKAKAGQIQQASAALAGFKPVSEEELGALTTLASERAKLQAGLEAGRLSFVLSPHKSFTVGVQKDLQPEERVDVGPGAPLQLDAGGRVFLRHADWELQVQSGEIGFEQLRATHRAKGEALDRLLQKLGVPDLESATKRHRDFKDVSNLKDQLDEILAGDDLDALKNAAAQVASTPPVRSSSAIAEDKGRIGASLQTRVAEMDTARQRLDDWSREFENAEKLLDRLLDIRGRTRAVETGLAALQPLPDGAVDADQFITSFREKEKRLKEIREEELPELKVARADLEGNAPRTSLRELDEELVAGVATFDRRLKEGEAVCRVAEVCRSLRDEMDAGTLDPWIENVKKVVEPLTGERYQQIQLGEAEANRAGGFRVPYRMLSVGTRSCLGLAVRLSMAQYFLEGRDGFLLLDDPLVDLDPQRQDSAATVLKDFASKKQVIIVTCHPRHADLLGGHRITMERTP